MAEVTGPYRFSTGDCDLRAVPNDDPLEPIAFAVVEDAAVSWRSYAAAADAVPGLILQVAGPTEEGVRTISVWESEADWRTFETTAAVAASHVRELRVLQFLEQISQRRASHA